jgi:hypothetical protein
MWVQANGKTTPKRPKHRLQAMKHGHIRHNQALKLQQMAETGHSFNNQHTSGFYGIFLLKIGTGQQK